MRSTGERFRLLAIAARLAAAAAVAVVAATAARAAPAAAGAPTGVPASPTPAATYVGANTCRGCHPIEADHWTPTVHGRLFAGGPRSELQARGCEACHGPGSAHVADPRDPAAIVSFTHGSAAAVESQNAMCLECHAGGPRIHWVGSVHETARLGCSDCHNPMAETSARGLLARRSVSETCFQCHPAQRIEFGKRSHMPLLEGKIACSDCHEPHGSSTDPLLRADSVTQLCTTCHADKRGPFLWEHAPVRESCSNCHLPHGSSHPALLTAAVPGLCQQCHSDIGGFGHPNDLLTRGNMASGAQPDVRLLNRGCVNCHAQIHGSNSPSGVRVPR